MYLLTALILIATGCDRSAGGGPLPNILVIVVDTLRADRLGVYGNQRGLTPFLDRLAEHGTVFRNAYAPSSWTCPSVASLLTSRYPSQHGVNSFSAKLSDDEVTVAEVLRSAGYRAGGFSANWRVKRKLGYAQGFDYWRVYRAARLVRGDFLRRRATEWLDRDAGASPGGTLLYLQYMEPHSPYEPPEPFRSSVVGSAVPRYQVRQANDKLASAPMPDLSADELDLLERLYNGEVASVDDEIRQLFDWLGERGFLDDAVIVVTADHGEGFAEHGALKHGLTLYEAAIRVPMLIVAPGFVGGRVVDQPVSLIDIAPTLLDLVGQTAPESFEGTSLVPELEPAAPWRRLRRQLAGWFEKPEPRDIIVQLEPNGAPRDIRFHSDALVRAPWKLLVGAGGRSTELYNLRADPAELDEARATATEESAALAEAVVDWRDRLAQDSARAEHEAIDDATAEKLRALGYEL